MNKRALFFIWRGRRGRIIFYIRFLLLFVILTTGGVFLIISNHVGKVKKTCNILRNVTYDSEIPYSLCSDKSTNYGPNQKVVSFSLFVKQGEEAYVVKKYVPGIYKNLEKIRELYPGWLMRIYTNINLYEVPGLQNLQFETDVFTCDVLCLPALGDFSDIDGRVWRFLPVLDTMVDVFVSRDLDSTVNEREKSAVNQWLKSDKTFHTMRDHPKHGTPVLAGMWGAKNTELNSEMRFALRYTFSKVTCPGMSDQDILTLAVYFPFLSYFMMHDSYSCERMPLSIPFPEQRKDIRHFVGGYSNLEYYEIVAECPVACRPDYGKNWTYC